MEPTCRAMATSSRARCSRVPFHSAQNNKCAKINIMMYQNVLTIFHSMSNIQSHIIIMHVRLIVDTVYTHICSTHFTILGYHQLTLIIHTTINRISINKFLWRLIIFHINYLNGTQVFIRQIIYFLLLLLLFFLVHS